MTIFHVARNGNDAFDGLTVATAFRTLAAAQAAMQASAGPDEAQVHQGRYQLTSPLTLTAADNGSAFVAAAGEDVTLSGGRMVSGWVQGANGIWTAPLNVADLNQLTLNGVNQTEARFPNTVPDDPVKGGWLFAGTLPQGLDPLTQMQVRPADLAALNLAPGMEVHIFAGVSWANDVLTVQAVDAATGVVTFAEAATYDLTTASRYFVQGTGVQLDKPGEWFFDPATKTVHFKAPPGFDGTGMVAAGDKSVIEIEGASDITIRGFTITDAATGEYSADIFTAGINVSGSDHVTIDANHFINLAKGVRIEAGSHDVTVDANDFRHLWSSAIELAADTRDNTLSGNDIRWVGEVFVQFSAIETTETLNNLISGNLIRDIPRMGISGSNYDRNLPSGGNIIEFNTIIHSMQATSDGGAIYFASDPDRNQLGEMIRYNRIIDKGGVETRAGGFIPGQEYSHGIYLDELTNNATVMGNFVQGAVRGGIYLHGGSFNTVFNNITIDNKDIGIQLYEVRQAMIGNDIFNNIVAMLGAGNNAVEANPSFVAPGTLHDNWYLTANGVSLFGSASFAAWQALGFDLGSVLLAGSPFVNPTGGDFTLAPGSVPGMGGFQPLPWAQMQAFRGGLIVAGTRGADLLAGSAGDDVMIGLQGADWFLGGAGADDIEGGAGRDTVSYAGALAGAVANVAGSGGGGDVLTGIENLTGSGFGDRLTGDSLANVLRGSGGNDTLIGGGGDDILTGGRGADRMAGGAGADVFVFVPADSNAAGQPDRITDFTSGADRIDLTRFGDLTLVSGLGGLSGAVVLLAGSVQVDLDGDGSADFQVLATGVQAGDLLIL